MALDLNNKSILITGGTGSFGKEFVRSIMRQFPHMQRLVVYSRDEFKQSEMAQHFSDPAYRCLQYVLGDVRDLAQLRSSCEGIDVLIHAAALKQVPTAEANPLEFVKTNVLGSENVIQAALDCRIPQVVALSTDKAAAPANLYGATKLCAEKLFVAASTRKGKRNVTFSVVRYGNVLGSRGSVVPLFLNKRPTGVLPVTHPDMTRFSMVPGKEVALILHALENAWGGEVFVPKLPSYRLVDLAEAIGPECRQEIIGIRPGEKMHEEMITETDAFHTVALDQYYVICPTLPQWDRQAFLAAFQAVPVAAGFRYHSNDNHDWLSVEELRKQILAQAEVSSGFPHQSALA